MLELEVSLPAAALLSLLQRQGLVVKLDTFDGKLRVPHWHLGFDKRPGVLEVTDLGDHCLVKVASNRDGGWANDLARDLARIGDG